MLNKEISPSRTTETAAQRAVRESLSGDIKRFLESGGEIKNLPYGPDNPPEEAFQQEENPPFDPKTGERLLTFSDMERETGRPRNSIRAFASKMKDFPKPFGKIEMKNSAGRPYLANCWRARDARLLELAMDSAEQKKQNGSIEEKLSSKDFFTRSEVTDLLASEGIFLNSDYLRNESNAGRLLKPTTPADLGVTGRKGVNMSAAIYTPDGAKEVIEQIKKRRQERCATTGG